MRETGKHGHEPVSKGRIAQFFDKNQPFGESAARSLALRLGLREDLFLHDDPAVTPGTPSLVAMDLARAFDAGVPEDLRHGVYTALVNQIGVLVAAFRTPTAPPGDAPMHEHRGRSKTPPS